MKFNSLNIMVKVASWIKKWLDLSHPTPWRKNNVESKHQEGIRQRSGMGSEPSKEVSG